MKFLIFTGLVLAASTGAATDYPPADHAGADVILVEGDRIWGTHLNIGTFRTTAGTTSTVHPYTTPGTGMLSIDAATIDLQGTLDATGVGWPGGAGQSPEYPAENGSGPYGAGTGGYMAQGINGDQTTDGSVVMGSGGRGGTGGPWTQVCPFGACVWIGPYGNTGGNGGGSIILKATQQFTAQGNAAVHASGRDGDDNSAGAPRAYPGAGGGILFDTQLANQTSFAPGFTVHTSGGRNTTNGGTIKFFGRSFAPTSALNLVAGRVYSTALSTVTANWTLLTSQCRTRGDQQQCSMKATLAVSADMLQPAAPLEIQYYLSDDSNLDDSDVLLPKSHRLKNIKPGVTRAVKLKAKLPTGVLPSGKYVIAVLTNTGEAGAMMTVPGILP